MKKQLLLPIFALFSLFLLGSISAFVTTASNELYVDVNKIYPITLLPLDNNIWNITLWIYEGNWSSFNFTWTGSQYELSILFNETGNYPFVVNSTEVTGDIRGMFYVREPYYVTFRFYEDKKATLFSSNKYINNVAYLTAEPVGVKTLFQNNYNPTLEPFIAPISDSRYLKPEFFSRYSIGEATIKLYDTGTYAIRLIDGDITFSGVYSAPNITKSYGTNVYVGKYTFTNSSSYSLILTEKDLHPFTWLFNWAFIILLIAIIVVSFFLLFFMPDKPFFPFILGFILIGMLVLLRIVIWFWKGF